MPLLPEEIQSIAAAVWAYTNRSLTTVMAGSVIPVAGEPLTIYRDTTITLDFSNAMVLTGAIVVFTIKDDLDALDTTAILQVQSTVGLNYLDGIEKLGTDKLWASLVIDLTNVKVTIKTDASVFLPVYQAKPVSWDLKANLAGIVTILQTGKIYVLPTATRMV